MGDEEKTDEESIADAIKKSIEALDKAREEGKKNS